MDAQYDMQAHGEQIRHAQIAEHAAQEAREKEAAETAHIALAEMDGSDLLDMCANNAALDNRMVILIERIAMLGVGGANVSSYHDDVIRAVRNLYDSMLDHVTYERVKDCK